VLATRLEDAAHVSGGHTDALFAPDDERQVAQVLLASRRVLTVGAQSSLTGGATPMGESLLSTSRLNQIEALDGNRVRVQAGVTLAELDARLRLAGGYYPPGPTFTGATIGGTVATNAAGAATFKYGTTRDWVQALTVVLPTGDVLDVERGVTRAHADGYFDLELAHANVRVPVPTYQMPRVAKLAAGYFAAPGMDLIDLFIGSEGTLGVVTAATLRVVPVRPAFCLVFAHFDDRDAALSFAKALRDAAEATRRLADPQGIDVAAIEHMDRRSLELLREDGVDCHNGTPVPPDAAMALLFTLELPAETSADDAFEQIGTATDPAAHDTPLRRLCRMLVDAGVLERVEIAVPGDLARATQLLALREGVPAAVNQRVARAKRTADDRIEKVAADMIVPFDRLGELLDVYDTEFACRGLDAAVWGHISDGNVHPNVIPRSFADVQAGRAAIVEFGRVALRLGGAPLAEHGVGRNGVKQALLEMMYGEAGIAEMRAVKHAIDPECKLAPGVLFKAP
jgi:D-lactate dehydrogenase (cytochrome)